jgi:hypothetical protein
MSRPGLFGNFTLETYRRGSEITSMRIRFTSWSSRFQGNSRGPFILEFLSVSPCANTPNFRYFSLIAN